ncbi:MAG: glutaredoxin 3 [Candidatus Thalassarchaeaceae archaeon]|jgi:glutaredoxin 3|tara:strand:- start:8007 stop:8288 length:282 start_codon:yes stop_codon:yes gene_type:complete
MKMSQLLEWFERTETDFILFSQTICQYCNRAKRILDSKNLSYTEVNLDHFDDLRNTVVKETRHRTVPAIFDLRKEKPLFIGGSDRLIEYLQER